jgi:hypothetical protein
LQQVLLTGLPGIFIKIKIKADNQAG